MAEQKVMIGNCLDRLRELPSELVDVCVTGPPYWNLRNYDNSIAIWGGNERCDHDWRNLTSMSYGLDEFMEEGGQQITSQFCSKCGAWKGQLGLEPSMFQFIEHLCMIFDEVHRVLKPEGSLWVNLGDTYNGNKKGNTECVKNIKVMTNTFMKKSEPTIASKSLCMIPGRFAIAMIDRGWILRNECIWHKPNVMPQSAMDRFTVDFEKFYFFVKQPRYYFKQQKEPVKQSSVDRSRYGFKSDKMNMTLDGGGISVNEMGERFVNPEGRNCRAVWSISTSGERYSHIAMCPTELIKRPIDACCPPGGTVLDVFAGSGTVLAYCRGNNINAIGIDINPANENIMNVRMNRAKDIHIRDLTNWI